MARKKPLKYVTILKTLLDGATLNRFEAERLGDHTLNSTISTLHNRFGIYIHAEREQVPCRVGLVSVNRYSLPTTEHEKARKLLGVQPVAGA
jgi:hypothetical protein